MFASGSRGYLALRRGFILTAICVLLGGCKSLRTGSRPAIEFSQVPPANEGGPDKIATIEGRVIGAHPGQRLVLFARSGQWWVQPWANRPFTTIQPDSSWKAPTHIGTEYAALLVNPDYHPPSTLITLPVPGGPIVAVTTVPGVKSASPRPATLEFSGYTWTIRNKMSNRNGFAYPYDPANARIDSNGFLHLRIVRNDNQWSCSEVALNQSPGYGTYSISLADVSHLPPAVVFGMFTWDDVGPDQNHREMDIEISRWGDPRRENARYVIQPYYIPANVSQYAAPAGLLTYSLQWKPGAASFATSRGTAGEAPALARYTFTSGIPAHGGESVRMSFCVFGTAKVPLQKDAEVVVEKFQYLP